MKNIQYDSNRSHLHNLTGIRGLAALWVILHHVQGSIVYETNSILFNISSRGWLAVDLFFILSGFVMCYVYQDNFQKDLSVKRYFNFLWLRFIRIYPVMLFVLVGLWVPVIIFLTKFLGVDLDQNFYSIRTFLYQILMLNGVGIPNSNGWNGPSWSVSSEFFAYLCFPIFIWVTRFLKSPVSVCCLLFIIIGNLVNLALIMNHGSKFMLDEPYSLIRISTEFLIGCVVYNGFLLTRKFSIQKKLGVFALISIPIISGLNLPHIFDFLYLISFAALIYCAAFRGKILDKVLGNCVMVYLGKISYSMYIIHWLIIVVVRNILNKIHIESAILNNGVALFTVYGGSIFLAHFLNKYVEENFRERLRTTFTKKQNRPSEIADSTTFPNIFLGPERL